MKRIRLALEGLGWLALWRLTRLLPERAAYRMFEAMGDRSYRRNQRRRRTVIANLTPVVGADEAPRIARDAFRWYGRYWAETFRMQDLSSEQVTARVDAVGEEYLRAARDSGRGGVFATLHVGNWDAGGRWAAERFGLTAVAEVLRPRSLFDRFVAHRESLGMTIIPLERGSDVTARCVERLEEGDILALVCDRDLSGTGVTVSMFGARTTMPAGPAVLALRTDRPLMTAVIYQTEEGRWPIVVNPPIEVDRSAPDAVERLTQRIADEFASFIAAHPEQWHNFTPYWLPEGS